MKCKLCVINNIIVEIVLLVMLFPSCTGSAPFSQNLPPAITGSTKQVIKQMPKKQRQEDSLQLLNLLKMNFNEIKILKLSINKSLPSLFSIGAKNMVAYHQRAIIDLTVILQYRNIKINNQADVNINNIYNKLNRENNNQFENDFLDWVIKTHKDAISQCQQYSKNAVDSEVSIWCVNAIPILQSHLGMAESAQKDINLNKNLQALAF